MVFNASVFDPIRTFYQNAFHDLTSLTVTSYTGTGRRQGRTEAYTVMLQSSEVITRVLKPAESVVVTSDKPVQVLQTIFQETGEQEAMAAIPARHTWSNMYLVPSLPTRLPGLVTQWATIVIDTALIPGLMVISQPDYTDLSPDLAWMTIDDSGMSTTTVRLTESSLLKIFHVDDQAGFQVMLYGVDTKGPGAFATTAGRLSNCMASDKRQSSARHSAAARQFERVKRSVTTVSTVATSTTTSGSSPTVTSTTTPSGSSTTTTAATVTNTTAASNATTAAIETNTTITSAPEANNTNTNTNSEGMSTGAIAGTAAAVGAAVTGAVVAAVAVNATGAAVAATGTAAAATTAVGANAAAAAGTAAAGNAAAAANATSVATGAMVSTTHGGGTAMMGAVNPAFVSVV
ncbi:hypothetical protein PoB_006028600 [Plakobranchus ocellatus]|uniref:Uncharacterized protein n=1 Tax=Plakobranchus ocellatus TaxID=259542 RepID=A0AAV4CPN8_9GAST|nr:hypothetical protein PoB_006028600 [Plakobranchus ocellatus]